MAGIQGDVAVVLTTILAISYQRHLPCGELYSYLMSSSGIQPYF